MSERPILFSAPMVRALLAGTKTQFRRLVKPQPKTVDERPRHLPNEWGFWGGSYPDHGSAVRCPFGAPGDRLWVRETWGLSRDVGGDWLRFAAGGEPLRINCDGAPRLSFVDNGRRTWRPSIHMPRWASRITLEVTGVRVERLQAISEEDARAEGVQRACEAGGDESIYGLPEMEEWHDTAVAAFRSLWESINGAESWAANPWVWVVSFKRVTP